MTLCQYGIMALWPICRLRPLDAVLSSGLCGKGGGLTSCDRLNSSENYLLLGFLLVRPITQDNCSISVSYRSSSNVTCLKNLSTLENKMKLFRRVELGQETIKSRNEVLPFFVNYEVPWRPPNKCKQTNKTIYLTSQKQYPESVSCSQQLTGRTSLRKFFLLKSHRAFSINPSLERPAGGMIKSFHSFRTWLYTCALQTADSNLFCTAVAPLPFVVGWTRIQTMESHHTFTKPPLLQRSRLTGSGNPLFESCVEGKAQQREFKCTAGALIKSPMTVHF